MSVAFKNYYEILGVDRKATEKEIKAAYRKMARKHHPDLHAKNEKAAAEEKFKEINEAYTVLGDAQKRAQYDQLGESGHSGQGRQTPPEAGGYERTSWGEADSDGFSDFFESLFGRARPGSARGGFGQERNVPGQDLESEIELTLEEAYHGGRKTLQFSYRDSSGAGSATSVKTLEVNIPPLVREGNKIRLKGQGASGSTSGAAGDLLLTVRVLPHACFTLVGSHLEVVLKIKPEQAVLGCQMPVPTLDGEVTVTVPPMSHNGQKLRLGSKGWPGKDGKRGDEYVILTIDIPRTLGTAEKEIYQRLADLRK